jgi:hypothetical protein
MSRTWWLGVVMIALVTGCTGGDPDPGPAAPPSVTTTPTTPPGPNDINCDHSIATLDAPTPGTRTVLGVVALPTEILQAVPVEGRLWSKRGLEVLAGAVVEISIAPEAAVGHAEIGWGSPGRPGTFQRVNGCSVLGCVAACGWLAFAGGYWVDAPACVPIVVRSNGREARVGVPVGGPCA